MRYVLAALLATCVSSCVGAPRDFSGSEALQLTGKAVAFGPRPSGSAALGLLRGFIRQQLAGCGCQVTTDAFTAATPDGPVAMENIVAKFAGKSGRAIAITGHFDTKQMAGFVGANDGGSSTGFLLELAAALTGRARVDDVYLVFFDGEEAVRDWSDTDSRYGSRHLAARWSGDGTNRQLKALVNVDMMGDKDLVLIDDENSTAALKKMVWKIGGALGHAAAFPVAPSLMEDDHLPFLAAGVPALDLIDFTYGPDNSYWHTTRDTMDKLGAASFDTIGAVVLRTIAELEQQQ